MDNKHTFFKVILSYVVGEHTYEDTFFINFVKPATLTQCKLYIAQDYMGYNPKKHSDPNNDEAYPHRCFSDISYADVNDIQTLKKYQLVSTVNNP
mgnify:CR=1 FL=1